MKTTIKPHKFITIFAVLALAFLFVFTFVRNSSTQNHIVKPNLYVNCNQLTNASAPIEPSNIIRDDNALHLLHARTNGLKRPFENELDVDTSINRMLENFELVQISSNENYQLKYLKHSHPYLIPEAASMIDEIATRFKIKLAERNLGNYSFLVTSVLRTEESQYKLSKRNSNATDTTAHLFGTTIDISYKHFYNHQTDTLEPNWEVIQVLKKTLLDMRKECKILAVKERKQSCFHITVVCCKPRSNIAQSE